MNDHSSSSRRELLEDVQESTKQGWKIYRALSSAPEALRDVQDGVLSLVGALRLVYEFSEEHQLSPADDRTLRDHLVRCKTVISNVQDALKNLRSQRGGLEEVAKFAQKLVVQAARISSFYEVLRRNVQEGIVKRLQELREIKSGEFQQSLVQDWPFVFSELQKCGISEEVVEEEYFFISDWLKESYSEDVNKGRVETAHNGAGPSNQETTFASSSEPRVDLLPTESLEDEELPGYTPSKKPTTVAEKVQTLDQTMAFRDLEGPAQMAASSSASPPAYTFEEGSDQEMDEEFSRYIQKAIGDELKRRYVQRDLNPEQGPHPYSWLPKSLQEQYAGRTEILTMMDAKSFTTMAYETAPRFLDEIERLLPVLSMSGSDAVFGDATHSLKTMSSAMHKFNAIQDQSPGNEIFSDLDTLDYEASTAGALTGDADFPEYDFDLAQKSYYLLLTYVMGMIGLMKDIFPGRTYVTRPRADLDQLWKQRKMGARTAWIEKQLAGWHKVEESILKCRDWHTRRPYLRSQAVSALQQWRQAQELLISSDIQDQIELTIISASGIPKPRMGLPTTLVKIVLYGSYGSIPSTSIKQLEVSTDVAKNTQNPVWNKTIPFTCPKWPKMLDLGICSRGGMGEREISSVRLKFSNIPGVERNFAGHSLMFGLDTIFEISLPSKMADGKGKEVEPPSLLVRLKWDGRFALLEQSGLMMSSPGKMFRQGVTGIPMPFDNNDTLSVREDRSRRSGSTGGLVAATT